MRVRRMVVMAGWIVPAVAVLAGCGDRLQRVLLPESPPTVRLTHARIAPPSPGTYAYLARWRGAGPQPPIRHFVYALDPASIDAVDSSWVETTDTERVLAFPAATETRSGREPHVFVVRAVTDRGELSPPAWIAFTEDNLPPIVVITNPIPGPFTPLLLPSVRIDWDGIDPDGQSTTRPVQYRYRLFGRINPDFPAIPDFISFAIMNPDSFRNLYAPTFPGWNAVSGDTTSAQYFNLIPNSTYLFAVTGFDEAGDYDPVFSSSKNMLRFDVTLAGAIGPRLTLFNEFFNYGYPTGGWYDDPARQVRVEVPADRPVTFNWLADPLEGSLIRWYRWVMDPYDLFDETPRTDEATDWRHWSARSLQVTSATVGPFHPLGPKREGHLLYVEVEDSNGLRSLGIIRFIVVRPTFTDELLFVDDTRLRPDVRSGPIGGPVDPPAGPWPTAAELDTFLFAVGGVPWNSYPEGSLSPPGIFHGYAFDTLGTRGLPLGMPLSVLGAYRHVVWFTDETGASFMSPPSDRSTPITALRLMSAPGWANALAAYVREGGKLWLCGGGAAYATLISWNRAGTSPTEYTPQNNELVPGRFMYDLVHWREGIQMLPAVTARKFGSTAFGEGTNRPGRHWPPAPPLPTPPAPPDYSLLPNGLNPKSLATDPPPPLRQADAFWFRNSYSAEHIHRPTFSREDYNDDPGLVEEYSTLDTLYITSGGTAPVNSPIMTYYHGRETTPLVFSGFNVWYWRRTECIALADWVLQQVWGLTRDAGAPRVAHPVPAGGRSVASGP